MNRALFLASLAFALYVAGVGWYCEHHNNNLYVGRAYRDACVTVFAAAMRAKLKSELGSPVVNEIKRRCSEFSDVYVREGKFR